MQGNLFYYLIDHLSVLSLCYNFSTLLIQSFGKKLLDHTYNLITAQHKHQSSTPSVIHVRRKVSQYYISISLYLCGFRIAYRKSDILAYIVMHNMLIDLIFDVPVCTIIYVTDANMKLPRR